MSSSPTGFPDHLRRLLKRADWLLPWAALAVIAGGTVAVLQVLVVKLIR